MSNIKIYFDESGQTGCVLRNKDILNFSTQPTFAVGALVIPSEKEAKTFLAKYQSFKRKFGIQGEIKGNELLTRERNQELKYFIRHILDSSHFYVLLYDKRFYLSTLLLHGLCGFHYQQTLIGHFYEQATMLSFQKDDFFLRYLQYIEKPSKEAFSDYLGFLTKYEYKTLNVEENAVVMMAEKILAEQKEELFFDDFLSFGDYDDPKQTNVINLNAVSELIYGIKTDQGYENHQISYIHDHIIEFEETFKLELHNLGMDFTFEDSKCEELLQIVDNAVSIIRHSYDKTIRNYKNKLAWEEESEWDMKLFASLLKKVSVPHINFTVPLCDWCAALCTGTMFSIDYPKHQRNNMFFNFHYQDNMRGIHESLLDAQRPLTEVLALMKK